MTKINKQQIIEKSKKFTLFENAELIMNYYNFHTNEFEEMLIELFEPDLIQVDQVNFEISDDGCFENRIWLVEKALKKNEKLNKEIKLKNKLNSIQEDF